MEFDFAASKLNNIYVNLDQDNNSFLVYTTSTQTACTLTCTDTKVFWCVDIDVKKINEEVKTAKFESRDKYIAYLSDNLRSSDFTLHTEKINGEDFLSLQIGNSPVLKLTFRTWSNVDREQELHNLLFNMAKHTCRITKELEKVKQDGIGTRTQSEYQSGIVMQEFNAKMQRGSAVPKIRRKPGMSVINPNSKKLKSEKGIKFN